MHTPEICLVIIFNHRYDKNIAKLEKIYGHRFHKILFLVPFYDGGRKNVISVYESSYQFPGFLIQAYEKLMYIGAEYYFFISDDLILSPKINEGNCLKELKMENKDIFTTDITPLNVEGMFAWSHARFSSLPFMRERTQWKDSIMTYEEALIKFRDFFGMKYLEEYNENFFGKDFCKDNPQKRYEEISLFLQRNGNSFKIPYPMAMGYSDIFMVKKEKLYAIARLCGIFSSMDMFAEITFPTSVVLSAESKEVTMLADTGYSADIRWGENRDAIEKDYQYNFSLLYNRWENKNLYIHPIKLSKWLV